MTKTGIDLGTMSTLVVGGQHYSARLSPGEPVRLTREPDNPHDPNAIRVENMAGEKAGHLPREVAAWLAPLLDAGKVRVEGAVGADSEDLLGLDRGDELPGLWKPEGIEVRLALCEAGRGILARNVAPATADEVFHEIVRDAWERTGALKDPEVAAMLGRRLSAMAAEDVPPQTRLLLALLPGRGRFVRDRMVGQSVRSLKTMLSELAMMPPVSCDGLIFFPLRLAAVQEAAFALFPQALESGDATVGEVGEGGSVPELMVENRTPLPLLIPEGFIILGLKQCRVMNVSMLVAAGGKTRIPVSCVEQGRWGRAQRAASGSWATPRLRSTKLEGVISSRERTGRPRSDQGRVWDEVTGSLSRLRVHSPTTSLSSAYEARAAKMAEYREKIRLPEGACGVLAGLAGRVLGLELFGAPSALSYVWPRLSEGYFLQALEEPEGASNVAVTADDARAFIRTTAAGLRAAPRQPELGIELEVRGKGLAGTALLHRDQLVHLTAFTGAGE